jgi:hypothetical protein
MANVVYFNEGIKIPCCPTLLESIYLASSGSCCTDSNTPYTGFVAGNLTYNIIYTLPTTSGTTGQVLTTDGNNNLSWTTVSGGGGGGTPAGIDGYIQYNNGGSFGGASILYWNDLNSRLGIGTATPNQTLEVAGTMRLTGSTGTPVSILGRDANGDISNVALGSNFLLSGGTLSLSGVTVSGYVPYTGATQNVNLGSFSLASSGVTTPYLQISTAGSSTPMQEGMLRWNDTDRTYEFMMGGGNVLQQIGQELPVPVKHVDNAGLQNGKVVYYVSSDGTNKLVRYAIASGESESAGVFGLMTEDASGGNKALCTTFGYVRDIDTSTLEEGKIVWLSDTELGGMTTTRPTQPSHGVQVGFCIRQHATEGAIFVSIQNGYELDELHNVLISSGITNQEMLFYNSVLKVWENKTAAAANLVSGSGTATQVAFWKSGSTNELQGNSNLYWDNVNTRLGVGTSTPQRALQVQGSILLGVNAEALQGISTGGSTVNLMRIDNSNNLAYGTQFNTTNTIFYTNTGFQFWTYPSGVLTEQFKILQNGNTGINVGTPTARLQVHGTDTSDSNWTAQFHNSLGNSNSLMIRNDGNVGIGTTGTTARLVVRGSGTTSAAAALLVQNSGGSQLLLVDNSGRLQFGSESVRLMSTGNGSSVGITGRGLLLDSLIGSATNIGEFTITGSISPSSGDTYTFRGRSTFIPTSGAATYSGLWVTTTINQTGGASGTTRGLFVDPVLTSAFDWRSIEWSNNTGWGLYGSGTANNYLAGNLSVGTTGSTARLVVRGTGTTSSSVSLSVQNSDGNALFRVFDNGVVNFGTQLNRGFWVNNDGSNIPDLAGASLRFSHSVSSQNQAGFVFRGANVLNATSGTQTNATFDQAFAPTSGAAAFNQILVSNSINQTGGASGTTRGLHVNPTLTSAFDWRSIEWSNSSGWGLYGAGTANNYLAGNLSVGTTGSTARLVVVGSQPSGTTTWTAQFHNALGNSNSLMIRDDGNVGIGTNTPQSLLQIGTGSSVGVISTPALRIGTNANGFYTDNNRLFVVANGNFGGGFDSSGFIGNSVYVNTTSGVNSLNIPKLGGYRLTAQGLTSGLAGNSVGDLALTTNNIPRLTITFSGNIGVGTTAPNASSILELSSTTQGFLSPRMTTAQRDAIVSPATGLELFNTSIGSKQVYNGTEWEILNGARQAITASSSTTSVVFRNGNIADIVLSSSTTLTFSNAAVGTYIVKITQGGSGFNLVSWPANVLWSGGIIPTLTTAVGKTDIFTFVYDSTNYYGSYALNY